MRPGITDEQSRLLASWLGSFSVVRDCSWPLQDTTVLHVGTPRGEEFIVKASTTSHHIRREIAAHGAGFPGLTGRVPVLRHASAEAGILVAEFLPGSLVAGTPAEDDPQTYRQAGELLKRIHRPAGVSAHYARALAVKTRSWLDRAHGLVPECQLNRLTRELEGLEPCAAEHEADLWRLENLNQAIGTVAWAHQVGDAAFEQSGRNMLDRLFSGA